MKIAAITSMDKKYYSHCGKAMLTSHKKNASDLFPLYVYNEDDFLVKVKTAHSIGWNLGTDYEEFQKRHSNEKVKTFAKKGFPIIDAMENFECDRLMWLDADLIIRQPIPLQLLELISPDDILSTHFSVWHTKDSVEYHSCETGFFILNKQHPGFEEFKNTYKTIYTQDKTEDLRRFYDGEVYGKTVELMEAKGYKMMNLNSGRHKTPISRSIMKPYITHFKAGLKDRFDNNTLESKFDLGDDDIAD